MTACTNCYAEARAKRFGNDGLWRGERRRTSVQNWNKPLRWNLEALASGKPRRVFCSSLSDVFEDRDDLIEWRRDLFTLIRATTALTWLLLTKRPEYAADYVRVEALPDNVWVGTTVENQRYADERIPHLLRIPAAVRFLSVEPMLGPVDLREWLPDPRSPFTQAGVWPTGGPGANRVRWVIAGGESGPKARPSHPEWFRGLRDQCSAANVPFLYKQWGEWRPPVEGERFNTLNGRAGKPPAFIVDIEGHVHCTDAAGPVHPQPMIRVGKVRAGRELDGRTHDEVPRG